jgi:hypothetical protein
VDRVEDLQGMNVFRQKPKETLGSVYLIVGRADFLPKHNANASVLLFLDGHKVLTVSAVVLVPAADLDLEQVHRNVVPPSGSKLRRPWLLRFSHMLQQVGCDFQKLGSGSRIRGAMRRRHTFLSKFTQEILSHGGAFRAYENSNTRPHGSFRHFHGIEKAAKPGVWGVGVTWPLGRTGRSWKTCRSLRRAMRPSVKRS